MINAQHLIGMVKAISMTLTANRERLDKLDGQLGDGDHGTGISTGFVGAAFEAQKLDNPTPTDVLKTTAMNLMNRMGGSSGALYGSLFLKASISTKGKATLTVDDFAQMWATALEGVKQRGKSDVGDKTMLDALAPAAAAFQGQTDIQTALDDAAQAANDGAEKTKDLIAKHGRAKFVGERGQGFVDAGAASIALMFEAIRDYWKGQLNGET